MSTLLSYALCTLDQVKDQLGITVGTHDDVLTRLINAATEEIENFCNRRFAEEIYTNELYTGDGGNYLFLRNAPVTAITSLQYMTGDYDSPNWEDMETELWEVDLTDDKNAGIIWSSQTFYKSKINNIRISYTAGYSTIPSDVQQACIDLVSEKWRRRNSQGIKSETLGDRSVTYNVQTNKGSAFDALGLDDVLMQYRLFDQGLA